MSTTRHTGRGGPWSATETPYMREVMHALCKPRVVVAKSSSVGKTTLSLPVLCAEIAAASDGARR